MLDEISYNQFCSGPHLALMGVALLLKLSELVSKNRVSRSELHPMAIRTVFILFAPELVIIHHLGLHAGNEYVGLVISVLSGMAVGSVIGFRFAGMIMDFSLKQ